MNLYLASVNETAERLSNRKNEIKSTLIIGICKRLSH